MAVTWNSGYNATPVGSTTPAASLDSILQEMKSELWKRLKLLFNFETDPDGGGYAFDLVDDVVLAEHISGLTGTGAVDADNIPGGSTNKYVAGGTLDEIGEGTTYKRVAAAAVGTAGVLNPVETVKDQGGIATDGLKCKIIEIGDWNMDSSTSKTVAHGMANIMTIRGITVIVRNDDNNTVYTMAGSFTTDANYAYCDLTVDYVDATNVSMHRVLSPGKFDSTNFNATSYNRGWITILYAA